MKKYWGGIIIFFIAFFATGVVAEDYPAYFVGHYPIWDLEGEYLGSTYFQVPPSWIKVVGTEGDLDLDGDIDIFDYSIFQANYGTPSGMTWEDGDLDRDEDVDIFDWVLFQVNYGKTPVINLTYVTDAAYGTITDRNYPAGTFTYTDCCGGEDYFYVQYYYAKSELTVWQTIRITMWD